MNSFDGTTVNCGAWFHAIGLIPDSRTPGRLASDRALRQLSRHYPRHYQTLSQLAASGAGIAADCSSCMLVRYC